MSQHEDSEWQVFTRRSFLQASLGLGALAVAGCPHTPPPKTGPTGSTGLGSTGLLGDEPIAPMPDGVAAKRFFGDDLRCHELLWDKNKALASRGGLPPDTTGAPRARVCVIGSGMAGLATAWLLRDYKPIVLETSGKLGGAAQAQSWGDLEYCIGSAYITNAKPGAPHMRMLSELGLKYRVDQPIHDRMYIDGKIYPQFWSGGSDPARAADFRFAWDYFKRIREKAFPEVPFAPKGQLTIEQYRTLDRRSFADLLRRELGKHLHPHLEDVVRQYCWSSFCADYSELSAAAGLNFFASDLGGMYVFVGGNAGITQAQVLALRRAGGAQAVRSSCTVLDVRRAGERVRVTYVDGANKVRTVVCQSCVVATPKFIVPKLIDDLPAAQRAAIGKLDYRAYLVANVLIDQPRKADFHDLYCIVGKAPKGSVRDEVPLRPFTDAIHASFTKGAHPRRTVLNLYRGLAYDNSPQDLFEPDAYKKYRGLIEPAVVPVMKALGLDPEKIHDLRLTRWGHALIIPKVGTLTNGVAQAASAPLQERIFFAQQDNHNMPAFESCFAAAQDAAGNVRRLLG